METDGGGSGGDRKYLQDVLESSKKLNDHWKWVESGNGVDRGYD